MLNSSKQLLRQQLLSKRHLIDSAEKQMLDQNIVELCRRFICDTDFHKIALFRSLQNEIDTSPIDDSLRLMTKSILYPRIDQINSQLTFHYIKGADDWEIGPLNILQPKPYCLIDTADLYIVPLIGYNSKGYRIGYGKGHYDHYFSRLNNNGHSFTTIGLAYAWQFTELMFQETFDYPLDYIINDVSISKV